MINRLERAGKLKVKAGTRSLLADSDIFYIPLIVQELFA